jgi:hypothetical protein
MQEEPLFLRVSLPLRKQSLLDEAENQKGGPLQDHLLIYIQPNSSPHLRTEPCLRTEVLRHAGVPYGGQAGPFS